MLSGEVGVSKAFLARWHIVGGYMDVFGVVVFCDFSKIYLVCGEMSCLCKGEAVPLQSWRSPEGSRMLRHPDL